MIIVRVGVAKAAAVYYGVFRVEEVGDDCFLNEEGGEKGGSRRWERRWLLRRGKLERDGSS